MKHEPSVFWTTFTTATTDRERESKKQHTHIQRSMQRSKLSKWWRKYQQQRSKIKDLSAIVRQRAGPLHLIFLLIQIECLGAGFYNDINALLQNPTTYSISWHEHRHRHRHRNISIQGFGCEIVVSSIHLMNFALFAHFVKSILLFSCEEKVHIRSWPTEYWLNFWFFMQMFASGIRFISFVWIT